MLIICPWIMHITLINQSQPVITRRYPLVTIPLLHVSKRSKTPCSHNACHLATKTRALFCNRWIFFRLFGWSEFISDSQVLLHYLFFNSYDIHMMALLMENYNTCIEARRCVVLNISILIMCSAQWVHTHLRSRALFTLHVFHLVLPHFLLCLCHLSLKRFAGLSAFSLFNGLRRSDLHNDTTSLW